MSNTTNAALKPENTNRLLEQEFHPWVYNMAKKGLAIAGVQYSELEIYIDNLDRFCMEFTADRITFYHLDSISRHFNTKLIDFGADPDKSISSSDLRVQMRQIRFTLSA